MRRKSKKHFVDLQASHRIRYIGHTICSFAVLYATLLMFHCLAKERQQAVCVRKPPLPFLPRCGYGNRGKPKNGLHTVPAACAHPLFPRWLSPYTKKSFHFLSRKRTVATMNRGQRVNMAKKSKRHTGGFILKKTETQHKRSPAPRCST